MFEDRTAGAHQDNDMIARKIPSLPFAGNLLHPMSLIVSLGKDHWCVSHSCGLSLRYIFRIFQTFSTLVIFTFNSFPCDFHYVSCLFPYDFDLSMTNWLSNLILNILSFKLVSTLVVRVKQPLDLLVFRG